MAGAGVGEGDDIQVSRVLKDLAGRIYFKCDGKSLKNLIRKPNILMYPFKNHSGCHDNKQCLRFYFSPCISVVIWNVTLVTKLKRPC